MSGHRSIPKNILKYAFSSVTTLFLFLLLIIAGRYLGAEDFGKFSFALAFVFLFDPILDPGLYHLLIREIARKKESAEQYLSHALTWKLMMAPLVLLLVFLIVNVIHNSPKTLHAVYLMAISLILKSLKDSFRTTLLAHEYFGLEVISLGVERFSLLLFGASALIMGQGLFGICWVFVLVRLFDLLIIAAMVKYKICRISLGYDFSFLKYLVITAVPIGAFYITLNIYNYVDTVMLSVFRSDAEVGWYNVSYKVYEGLLIVPVVIGTVFMPRLSQLYKEHKQAFTVLLFRGLKYILLLSLFVSANGILFSDNIITLLFGDDYVNAIMPLNILLVGLIFVFTISFLQIVMITMDKQKLIFCLAVLGLFFNVCLNLFLITRYGYLGAAFATVIVEFFVFLSLFLYVHKFIQKIAWWNLVGKPLISLLAPALIVWIVFPDALVYVKLVLVNLCFITLLYLTRVFDQEELSWISNVLSFRKTFRLK